MTKKLKKNDVDKCIASICIHLVFGDCEAKSSTIRHEDIINSCIIAVELVIEFFFPSD